MLNLSAKDLFIAVATASVVAFGAHAAASEKVHQEVDQRTAPVGDVCIKGDPCAAAATVASAGPRSGETIYKASCSACHAAGVAGAPLFADVAQWQPRIAKGLETLYANSINGINAMPAKGLCMDCSDDEIKVTVDYMVEAAQ